MRLFRGPVQTAYIFKKKSNIPQGSNTPNPNLNKTTTAARAKTIPKLKTIPNWNHPSSWLGALLQPSTAMEQPIWRTVFFLITFSNGSINCNYLRFEGSLNISFYCSSVFFFGISPTKVIHHSNYLFSTFSIDTNINWLCLSCPVNLLVEVVWLKLFLHCWQHNIYKGEWLF